MSPLKGLKARLQERDSPSKARLQECDSKARLQERDSPSKPPAPAPALDADLPAAPTKAPEAPAPPAPSAAASVTVAAHVRPWVEAVDGPDGGDRGCRVVSATGVRVFAGGGGPGRGFRLHAAVDAAAADDFYDRVCRGVAAVAASGGRGALVLYGATGSGKTHCARAAQTRAARQLLAETGGAVGVSFLETCGERCGDLLRNRAAVPLRADEAGDIRAAGLKVADCADGDAFDAALAEANALRATAATERHAESSRSHAVCDLVCANGGRLRVVDLAGSERLRAGAAGTDDARLREARDINASLACLTECLRARLLRASGGKAKHVPYRRSKLTMLLKDCFEGDGATAFVAVASPAPACAAESKRTLDYAAATLEASQLDKERETFKGPEKWSPAACEKWCAALDGGKYAHLAPAFAKSGKTLATIYRGDLLRQVEALGGSERDCEHLYDTFKALVKDAKRKKPARSALGKAADRDAALLEKNKDRATASDIYGAATGELDFLAAKHAALDLKEGS